MYNTTTHASSFATATHNLVDFNKKIIFQPKKKKKIICLQKVIRNNILSEFLKEKKVI